jgi:hypothetical protein
MKTKSASIFVVVGSWTIVAVIGLLLGWWFNSAYFSMLGETSRSIVEFLSLTSLYFREDIMPYAERVFEVWLVAQVAVSVLCLGVALPRLLPTPGARRAVLVSGLCLPLVFCLVAAMARPLTQKGVLGPSSLDGLALPKLAKGESVVIGGYKFSKTSFGLGVENLGDTRSVPKILVYDVESAWENNRGVTILAALLWLGLGAAVVRLWTVKAGGPGQSPA